MATEILLLSDVKDLGKAGDVVKVADGFARNYLLPKDLAAPVTKHALRRLEKLRKEREELTRIQKAEAQAKAGKLGDAAITIRAKTVDGTRLYGSIAAADIAAALVESTKVEIDKTQVALAEPLKEIGTFDVTIKLHPEVTLTVKVSVVEG
jgi:large subunit ribosomal protein L9